MSLQSVRLWRRDIDEQEELIIQDISFSSTPIRVSRHFG